MLSKHFEEEMPAPETALSELEFDSLDLMEVIFELELETGRALSNKELASLNTVNDLLQSFGCGRIRAER